MWLVAKIHLSKCVAWHFFVWTWHVPRLRLVFLSSQLLCLTNRSRWTVSVRNNNKYEFYSKADRSPMCCSCTCMVRCYDFIEQWPSTEQQRNDRMLCIPTPGHSKTISDARAFWTITNKKIICKMHIYSRLRDVLNLVQKYPKNL